jgi:drug/metabolite transporter (DMT)-like permease
MNLNKLPKNLLRGYAFLLIATILWAAAGPVIKYTLKYIPPMTFLFLRFLIASLVMLPYAVYEIQKIGIDRKDFFGIFLFGVLNQTSISLIFLGLEKTTAIDNAIIGILGSILAVTAGAYFYSEKPNKNIKIGLIIASLGTLVVMLEPILLEGLGTNTKNRFIGNLILFSYNVVWVLSIVWAKSCAGVKSKAIDKYIDLIRIKPLTKKYPPALMTALSFFVGVTTLAPLAFLEMIKRPDYNFSVASMNTNSVIGLMYLALFSSIVAYVVYQKSLEDVRVTDTAFFHYLSPIFSIPVAYVLLGETVNIYALIGIVLIFIGVYIAEVKKP